MGSKKGYANLRPVKTHEEAVERGRKGGIITGQKTSLKKAVKTFFKDAMFGTLDDAKKKLEDNNQPMISKIILSMLELSQNAKNEDVRRKVDCDILRYAGLEPEQVVRQEQVGIQTVYVSTKNSKKTNDSLDKVLTRNNIINKKK